MKHGDESRRDKSDNFEEEEEERDAFEEENDSFEEDDDHKISEKNESADDGNANDSKKPHENWCHLSPPINESESGLQGYMKPKEPKDYA